MTDYQYIRKVVNGSWDVNNEVLKDAKGTVILAQVVHQQFPANGKVNLEANGPDVTISIEIALDAAGKLKLDKVVADYENGILPI